MKGNIFLLHGWFYDYNVGGRRRVLVVLSSSVLKRKYFTPNLNFKLFNSLSQTAPAGYLKGSYVGQLYV